MEERLWDRCSIPPLTDRVAPSPHCVRARTPPHPRHFRPGCHPSGPGGDKERRHWTVRDKASQSIRYMYSEEAQIIQGSIRDGRQYSTVWTFGLSWLPFSLMLWVSPASSTSATLPCVGLLQSSAS